MKALLAATSLLVLTLACRHAPINDSERAAAIDAALDVLQQNDPGAEVILVLPDDISPEIRNTLLANGRHLVTTSAVPTTQDYVLPPHYARLGSVNLRGGNGMVSMTLGPIGAPPKDPKVMSMDCGRTFIISLERGSRNTWGGKVTGISMC